VLDHEEPAGLSKLDTKWQYQALKGVGGWERKTSAQPAGGCATRRETSR